MFKNTFCFEKDWILRKRFPAWARSGGWCLFLLPATSFSQTRRFVPISVRSLFSWQVLDWDLLCEPPTPSKTFTANTLIVITFTNNCLKQNENFMSKGIFIELFVCETQCHRVFFLTNNKIAIAKFNVNKFLTRNP